MRSLLAGFSIIIPLVLLKRLRINRETVAYALIIGCTYTGLGFGGMFLADGRIAPGLATILANTQPLIAAIFAYFILHERLEVQNIVGLGLGFLGIMVIAGPSVFSSTPTGQFTGIALILLGAVGTGSGNVMMKRSNERCDLWTLTGLQFLIGGLALLILSMLFEPQQPIFWHSSFSWSLVILALPGTSIATLAWIRLLKIVPLTKLNVFTFLTPIFGIVIGYTFFDERFSAVQALGALLALIGVYLATRSEPKTLSRKRL